MALNMSKITNSFSNAFADNNTKKLLEEKEKERLKIYGFIGIDTYALHKQGKAEFPELEIHFEKIEALEQEIAELEAEKQRRELQCKKTTICTCGQSLAAGDSFCPNCGKQIANGMITCTCGKQVKDNLKFCPNCGRSLSDIWENNRQQSANILPQIKYRECICGAKVPGGQFMCMECGRKVEN